MRVWTKRRGVEEAVSPGKERIGKKDCCGSKGLLRDGGRDTGRRGERRGRRVGTKTGKEGGGVEIQEEGEKDGEGGWGEWKCKTREEGGWFD